MNMKIKLKMVLMAIVPMLISGIIITFAALSLSRSALNDEQETILRVALEGYSGNVNAFQDQEVDITVFEGDTRVESSIEGVVGTKASDKVRRITAIMCRPRMECCFPGRSRRWSRAA